MRNYRTTAHLAHTGLWEGNPNPTMATTHLPEPAHWYLAVETFPLWFPIVNSPYARHAHNTQAEAASKPPENQYEEFCYQYHTADRSSRWLRLILISSASFSDLLRGICISGSPTRARRRRFPVLLCQELDVHESTRASI